MALSGMIKDYEKEEKVRVVDLLKEQELLQAKYFAGDEVLCIAGYTENNALMEGQTVSHDKEVSDALKRYLQIEDILNGIYAEYTIVIRGFRFTVATGRKLLKEMETPDYDKITGHMLISHHPVARFLSQCHAGSRNCRQEAAQLPDRKHLPGNMTPEDVPCRIEEFKIELKYAIEKFNLETEVIS